ncbi:MAG: hypothetical protein ABI776_07795 [Nocardioidaceae bacterium]
MYLYLDELREREMGRQDLVVVPPSPGALTMVVAGFNARLRMLR